MLVEDNPTDVFVITDVIARSGFACRIEVARNGEEALAALQSSVPKPALLLLDLNIPKIAGVEVLRRMRAEPEMSRIPVVVITSSRSESDRRAVESLGAEVYFPKPHSLEEYMELGPVLERWLPRPQPR